MMPRLHLLILLSASVLLTGSCRKDSRPELTVLTQVFDFEVRSGLNTSVTHFFLSGPLNNPYEQQLADVGRTPEDVDAVVPKFAQMSEVFNDIDLDFVSAVEVRVYDPFDPEDSSKEVFYMIPVPANTGTVVRPFPGLQNVEDIVSGPTYGIEVRLIFRRVPQTTFNMRFEMQLSVKGK